MTTRSEKLVTRILDEAGIEVNGGDASDIRIRDERLYRRVLAAGSLGLGESYMDEWWDCEDLEEFLYRLLMWRHSRLNSPLLRGARIWFDTRRWLLNLQTVRRARHVVDAHYDLPPHLFENMLGESMAYSCAYWRDANSLDQAQRNKLDLICRKLELTPADRVLDLGCGFGSFARFAAENYGCSVVAVTLSPNQAAYAREFCKGLPVEIHVCDYRDVERYSAGQKFDKVASIAMFEAIGRKNFRSYMKLVHDLLPERGLWLLHTIGDNICSSDPWMERYIFPNGELPTINQISKSLFNLFDLEDFHNFGLDYRRTLHEWEVNFREKWDQIRAENQSLFDSRFFRMWIYYLNCCKASFRSRNMHLWQLVMTKGYFSLGYQSVR